MQRNLSVLKLLDVLDALAVSGPSRVADLSRQTGLSKSNISRLLGTLLERSVVVRDRETRRYDLGPRMVVWGGSYLSRQVVALVALPFMRELRDRVGESVELYTLARGFRVCIQRAPSTYSVGRSEPLGTPLPLHCGAAGKVLIAYLTPEERRALLGAGPYRAYTDRTVTDPQALEADLARIRSQGYAVSLGEREPGAFSVVAPVVNASGEALASLSISGPTSRLDEGTASRYIAEVVSTARQISERLGAVPSDGSPGRF